MSATPPTPLLRLCPKHGIVAGPDGRCVICHRGDEAGKQQSGAVGIVAGLAALVLVVAGVVAWKAQARRHPEEARVEEVHRDAPLPAAAPAAPATIDEPSDQALEERKAVARSGAIERLNRDVEAEMRRVPIRLYVDDKCDLCNTAREFLKREGLSFTEVDVGASPSALEDLKRRSPTPTVPSLDVDGELLVGFGPAQVLGAVRRAADRRVR